MYLLESIKYNITRRNLKKKITNNLGKVIETDDKLICYVNKDNCSKINNHYYIQCHGIKEKDIELMKKYNLNKTICYVIDDFKVEKRPFNLFGYDNCEVIIKNSKFNLGLLVKVDGKCTIENTDIRTSSELKMNAKDLIIKNMEITNYLANVEDLTVRIAAINDVYVIDSTIGEINKRTKVNINSKNNVELINSNINANSVVCNAKSIISDENSVLEGRDKVDLEVKDYKKIRVKAPFVYVNGRINVSNNKELILEKITDPIRLKRIELIDIMKKIKKQCEIEKKRQIEEYEKTIDNSAFTKVLRK